MNNIVLRAVFSSSARVGASCCRNLGVARFSQDRRSRFSQDTFQRPQGAAIQEAQAFVNDDELSSGRHSVIQEEEQKPIQHTYNFLDDQTEGVACLQEVCVKLDPHAVAPTEPVDGPSHTYNFLDDHTEGLDMDPHAVKEFVPPSHTYSFLDDQTEGVGCLDDVCQKLDPDAVTGVLDDFVPPTHTYSFLDDQTEGVAVLNDVSQKLDPHAVTGVLDEKEFVPPTHTYSFLDDATEGVDLDPIELIQANENKK